ncbi:MAG: phospholipid carrier-dependent glycosyltransferase [Chloroflexi bacterium]|nr:phospholipid carrier-dependent glycosyltransferase [Chloroflexota bacterium]
MNHPQTTIYHPQWEKILIVAITLLAFAVRVWQLEGVPPGWRDDELINSLVISQKVLAGEWQVYYADASGHEALYHVLNAAFLGLFGANIVGIRLLSVFLGTLTVPLTWLLGRKLWGRTVGLLAAAGLALGFWSLMYSRIGLRHILMPVTMLLAFYFFWNGLDSRRLEIGDWKLGTLKISNLQSPISFVIAGIWIGLGFYVYFASRGVPLILGVFSVYLAVVARPLLKQKWRGIALMFGVAAVLALPLFITLGRQPESEARVSELAVPLVEAGLGNFTPLQKHIIATLSMFHADGDAEWLYNIPHRPLFGPLGAILFWAGVAITTYYAFLSIFQYLRTLIRRPTTDRQPPTADYGSRNSDDRLRITNYSLPSAFLLIWWLAGISPGFISVPPASLGHTILAQPVTFMLMAVPVDRFASGKFAGSKFTAAALGIVLLLSIAARDFPDYFAEWPQRGMTRFLYRAEIDDVAAYVNEHPELTDFGIAGLLAGPWDKLALQIGLKGSTAVFPRWYNPERAIFVEPSTLFTEYPDVPAAFEGSWQKSEKVDRTGGYWLSQVNTAVSTDNATCFQNGLCVVSAEYDPETGVLVLGWWAERPLDLPPFQLISNPPPPGIDTRPRLSVFAQLLDAEGNFMTGDDGLWVDPYSVQPGDIFLQQHYLNLPGKMDSAVIAFGLYDPLLETRILTDDGRDHITLEIR